MLTYFVYWYLIGILIFISLGIILYQFRKDKSEISMRRIDATHIRFYFKRDPFSYYLLFLCLTFSTLFLAFGRFLTWNLLSERISFGFEIIIAALFAAGLILFPLFLLYQALWCYGPQIIYISGNYVYNWSILIRLQKFRRKTITQIAPKTIIAGNRHQCTYLLATISGKKRKLAFINTHSMRDSPELKELQREILNEAL